MKVNNIQNNSFRAVYKMPCTEEYVKELIQKVVPVYENIRHEKIFYFCGSNPGKIFIVNFIKNLAEKMYGISWLKMNAQYHGLDIDNIDKVDSMYIFSGNSDINNLLEYIKGRKEQKTNLFSKIKSMFKNDEEMYVLPKNLPEHLRGVYYCKKTNMEEDEAFERFYKLVTKEVKTPRELLKALLTEK